ncbi:hypothetical protein ACFIOY_39460 [Bradyrhizobium sp. TZ2]
MAKAQGSGDLAEAPGAAIGTTSHEACASLSLIERDRVVRGAKAEPFWFADSIVSGAAREDGLAHFTSARLLLPALALNPFCEQGELEWPISCLRNS